MARKFDLNVRLAAVHREGELEALLQAEKEQPTPSSRKREPKPAKNPGQKPQQARATEPGEEPKPGVPRLPPRQAKRKSTLPKAVRQYYEAAPGYANYWFNRYHQQRIWNAYLAHGDFAETGWNWKINGKTTDAAAMSPSI